MAELMSHCSVRQTDSLQVRYAPYTHTNRWLRKCRGQSSGNQARDFTISYFCFAATYRLTRLLNQHQLLWAGLFRHLALPCWSSSTGFEWLHHICGHTCFRHWDFLQSRIFPLAEMAQVCEQHNASPIIWTGKQLLRSPNVFQYICFSFVLMVAVLAHLDELQVFLNPLHYVYKKSHWAMNTIHSP